MTISQAYDTDAADLWDACTNIERIPRWFLPITGDLKVGGRYQLDGNANGTILTCDPPREFTATWEFGGDVSWIEVRITGEGPHRSRFELRTHLACRRPLGASSAPARSGWVTTAPWSDWPSICRRARPSTRRPASSGWPPRTAADS